MKEIGKMEFKMGKVNKLFDDGPYYDGYFKNGLRHGKGKFKNRDGTFC